MIHIVAAIGKNRELGKDNALLWQIPEDLKHFKELTLGHPVIMGRKTFDSIVAALGKPLPGRTNIVITRDADWRHDGALRAPSLEDALTQAQAIDTDVFVIGGAQIYGQSLPYADVLHLTLVDDSKDADSFFPPFEDMFTKSDVSEVHESGAVLYHFATLEKTKR